MDKTCNKCGNTYEASEVYFRRCNKVKDGFQGTCKQCLGSKFGMRENTKKWSDEQIQFLKDNFYDMSQDELVEKIGKIWATVASYATKVLKLKRKHGKYKTPDGRRACKTCGVEMEENESNFYKDGNSYRSECIKCFLDSQRVPVEKSLIKTKRVMAEKSMYYCGKCKNWYPKDKFYVDKSGRVHRWCAECSMKGYYKRNYGDENLYYAAQNERIFDNNGDVCFSGPEKLITDWLIESKMRFNKYVPYKELLPNDKTKRTFDWSVNIDGQMMFVEYFGFLDGHDSKITKQYKQRVEKKIDDISMNNCLDKCIFIYPKDLKEKTLDTIFGIC